MSTTQSPPRRLVRRTDDRVVAGVASGVADMLGLDPVLVRIGFVVLAFVGGSGIIVYLALWLLAPQVAGGATPVATAGERGPAFWIAIGLFVLAALVIADTVAERSVVWPLVLIMTGVALWRSDRPRRRTETAGTTASPDMAAPPDMAATPGVTATVATEGTPPGTVPQAPTEPFGGSQATEPVPAWTPPPAPSSGRRLAGGGPAGPRGPAGPGHDPGDPGWTPPPARPRDRSILGRLTLGVALVAVGVLAVLDAADVLDLTVRDAVAVTLLVVGLGLVVGTWIGRARWLAFPALLLLLPGLVLASVVSELDVPLGAGLGERSVGTTAVADVDPLYELGIGQLTVDLGALDLDGATVETTVRVGLGQATVVVPDDARVDVSWKLTGGEVDLFDGQRSGRRLEGSEVFAGDEGAGTIVLDMEAALGQLVVVRDSDRPLVDGPRFEDRFDGVQLDLGRARTVDR